MKTKTVGKETKVETETVAPETAVPVVVVEAPAAMAAPDPLKAAAWAFKRLYRRLEENAAHSVLNWDEMNEVNVLLTPFMPTAEEEAAALLEGGVGGKPAEEKLPEGERWATIVGEPMNRMQKFIKFAGDEATAPYQILHVKADYGFMHPNRMIGRKVRVKKGGDERTGGWVLA